MTTRIVSIDHPLYLLPDIKSQPLDCNQPETNQKNNWLDGATLLYPRYFCDEPCRKYPTSASIRTKSTISFECKTNDRRPCKPSHAHTSLTSLSFERWFLKAPTLMRSFRKTSARAAQESLSIDHIPSTLPRFIRKIIHEEDTLPFGVH